MSKCLWVLVAIILLVSGAVRTGVYAQTATGSVFGTVTDSTGAAVPGATVTITNKSTSAVRTLTSNNNGLYSAPGLEAGEYTVHIEQKGFKSVTLDALVQAGSGSAASV